MVVRPFPVATALLLATASLSWAQATSWVRSGQAGRLVYGADASGDRIGNFSMAGYKSGNQAIPDVTTLGLPVIHVSPNGTGDSLAAINAAIANAASRPIQANGFRAIVQLSAGQFRISNSININNTGIILRGVGSGTNLASNTVLAYTGTSQIDMIHVDSAASRTTSGMNYVTDKTVPAGSYGMSLDSVAGYAAGDKIVIRRPSPANWINDIGMNSIPQNARGSVVQWAPGSKDQIYERAITYVDPVSKRIMLDAPLPISLQSKYGDASTTRTVNGVSTQYAATISHYSFARTSQVGIENLRGDGQLVLTTPTAENHANSFVVMQDTENAWVRNVASVHQVYAGVEVGANARNITVANASNTEPVSQISGSRRYSFNIEGQFTLMRDLISSNSRHDFVNNSPSRGPNVFLNGTATSSNDESGPHQRWSTGTLYDNISTNRSINVQNRTNNGTGHGWSGANMVVWNSQAGDGYYYQSPPTAQNWIIGSTGTVRSTSRYSAAPGSYPAYAEANNTGQKVTLYVNGIAYSSLYEAQLADRLANPQEVIRHYVLGDYDNYAAGDAADTPYVDPEWKTVAQMVTSNPLVGFDTASSNIAVPFTFAGLIDPAQEEITSAVVTLALRGMGIPGNDQLYVDGRANVLNFASDPRLANPMNFSVTNNGVTFTSSIYVLEFTKDDPKLNLALLRDGKLNLLLNDNRNVDWADIQYTVAPRADASSALLGPLMSPIPGPALLAPLILAPADPVAQRPTLLVM